MTSWSTTTMCRTCQVMFMKSWVVERFSVDPAVYCWRLSVSVELIVLSQSSDAHKLQAHVVNVQQGAGLFPFHWPYRDLKVQHCSCRPELYSQDCCQSWLCSRWLTPELRLKVTIRTQLVGPGSDKKIRYDVQEIAGFGCVRRTIYINNNIIIKTIYL